VTDEEYYNWAKQVRSKYAPETANRILSKGPYVALEAAEERANTAREELEVMERSYATLLAKAEERASQLQEARNAAEIALDVEIAACAEAEHRASQLEHERDDWKRGVFIQEGNVTVPVHLYHEMEQARREADRCPACTHEWRRHDPEDGKCDAGSDDLGECPCGRDISFHRVRNAALSLDALAGVQAKEHRHGRECGCTPCKAEDWDAIDAGLGVQAKERPITVDELRGQVSGGAMRSKSPAPGQAEDGGVQVKEERLPTLAEIEGRENLHDKPRWEQYNKITSGPIHKDSGHRIACRHLRGGEWKCNCDKLDGTDDVR